MVRWEGICHLTDTFLIRVMLPFFQHNIFVIDNNARRCICKINLFYWIKALKEKTNSHL
jgi:hypothetical protein